MRLQCEEEELDCVGFLQRDGCGDWQGTREHPAVEVVDTTEGVGRGLPLREP